MLFCVTFYRVDHERPAVSSSTPLIFMAIRMLTPADLDSGSCSVSLKAESVSSLPLFFFKIVLAILGPFHVHKIIGSLCQFLQTHAGILVVIIGAEI